MRARLVGAFALVVWTLVVPHSLANACTPSEAPADLSSAPALIRNLLDDGRFAEAEKLARANVAERESAFGEDSIEVAEALDLLVEARWHIEDADEEALEQARRAVSIKEKRLASDDARLVTSLNNLARILTLRGEYEVTKPICQRAFSMAEKLLGPDHLEVAESLSALGDVLYSTGEYLGSEQHYERALAIREEKLGSNHPKVARSLWDWSGPLWSRGDFQDARRVLERALAIQQRVLRTDHPDVADTLNMMSNVDWDAGEVGTSTRLLERAAAIAEPAFGPDSPRLAMILSNLALARVFLDDYIEAKRLLERSLAINERAYGPESRQFARSEGLFGRLLAIMGDYPEAERMISHALTTLERILGPEHDEVALALIRLAYLNSEKGDHLDACLNLHRALVINEKAFGPNYPFVAEILINLGQNHEALGEYEKAEALFRRALGIYERQVPSRQNVGWALTNLADALTHTGRYAEAMPLYERGLIILEQAYGPDTPAVAWDLAHFAEALISAGETRRGFDLALRAEEIGRNHLRLTARALPERQALRFGAVRLSGADLALSVAAEGVDRSLAQQVWDTVIRSRGLITDEISARVRALTGTDHPEIRSGYTALTAARQRLANLTIRGPAQDPPGRFRALLDGARNEEERAEQALAENSLAFRGERTLHRAGFPEIRSALPPGSGLVAFTRYLQHEMTPKNHARAAREKDRTQAFYAVFVLRAGDQEPQLLRLGRATEIESLVSRWEKEIARGGSGRPPKETVVQYRAAGAALRRRIWDPVTARLGHPERIFVVLDGSLNSVNLGALPVDRGTYLVETGPLIQYLSAERDIIPRMAEERRGEGMLALGGPAFDESAIFTASTGGGAAAKQGESVAVASLSSYRGKRSACGDFQSLRFEPLPQSEREVNEVVALWKSGPDVDTHAGGREGQALRLTGASASESAFKALAPGRRVIHLATHGFFLGGRCASALDSSRPSGGPPMGEDPTAPPPLIGENPLLLSGLALAGANHRASAGPEDDDGILTAEEVAAMDLSGVDLVVLSACDTGVGEFMPGEGIFGLRRAFQVAGAKTVVTSLWSVEDEATRAWMRTLYQERMAGASTAVAVRNASRKMIESLRQTGLPAHPYLWGAFVAIGD